MFFCLLISLFLTWFWAFVFIVKYKKNGGRVFLNPTFYLSCVSFLYLIFPTLVIFLLGINNPMLNYSYESNAINSYLSLYCFCVFVFFYVISDDPVIDINTQYSNVKAEKWILFIIIFVIIIYILNISYIYSSTLNSIQYRMDKYHFFESVIVSHYPKVLLISKLFGFLIAYKYYTTKNALWLIASIPFLYFDHLIQGRTITLYVLLPSVIFVLYNYYKYALILSVFCVFYLGISSLTREVSHGSIFFTMFGEFFATRESTSYVINNNYHDSILHLLSNFIYSFFPGYIGYKLNSYDVSSYTVQLSNLINERVGFSGNIIGEAYFYGGYVFSFISPIIIGFIYRYFSKYKIDNTYKLIILIMLCSYSIWFMRSEFYVTFGSMMYMIIFYIFPILFIFNRVKKHAK
ncbi:hypothetical protein C9J21_16770 [Photobacterium phosphoreum]|uniref:O-antigen polymerase n=1 Tax=Photobacterium phosphoreum TaxID=659 RepID=UPI000D16A3DA|nr:O-antigen polymerase [Photobacterium phosphoreum]PSW31395.1 hypothetical protein C9J21_16770 [Photobacterium phosphoreum]